ncbi:antibiotic biosynthesis monooxygenase [Alloacidobacterium sp.]|uniref:antibiotic biosynthesis monooxygenase n=1 Tax=Alloacidobacterium sp. TaxID=2951999 RepID=UPI002D2753BF|nr:antibiotic biosynthesis monooxygenase [Alloacidobacterium sp.]HYK35563.1 antibiotic biosynthesis monooxygenase [Alloacidobacterium sp.]
MITRLWQGYTTPENADAYEAFIRAEIFPKLHEVRGFLGGKLLRRELFQEVEFVALTHFASLESVRAAAGEEYGYIIIPEAGRKLLSRFDQRVAVYEVVVEAAPN